MNSIQQQQYKTSIKLTNVNSKVSLAVYQISLCIKHTRKMWYTLLTDVIA